MRVLAGDVGATKTILAIFDSKNIFSPLWIEKFPTQDYPSLEQIFEEFLKKKINNIETVCLGIAGPVVDGHVKAANISWEADENSLKTHIQINHVKFINDVQAMIFSVPILRSGDTFVINQGENRPKGNIALIAPGTGLGEGFLLWDGNSYHPIASEGGHTDFAATNEDEINLLNFLLQKYHHVSYERLISGQGIREIFEYLEATQKYRIPEEMRAAKSDGDIAAAISKCAMTGDYEICVKTMSLFVSILANEASNLALKFLAYGGVYLGGGIPAKILPLLKSGNFMEHFTDKGRLRNILEKIPVHVILNDQAALLGAAYFAIKMLK